MSICLGLPRHFVPRNDRIGCVKNNIKVIIQKTKYFQFIIISLPVMKASCKYSTLTLVLPPQGGGNEKHDSWFNQYIVSRIKYRKNN